MPDILLSYPIPSLDPVICYCNLNALFSFLLHTKNYSSRMIRLGFKTFGHLQMYVKAAVLCSRLMRQGQTSNLKCFMVY